MSISTHALAAFGALALCLACAPYESDDLGADDATSAATNSSNGGSFTAGETSSDAGSDSDSASDTASDASGSSDTGDSASTSGNTSDDGGFVDTDLGQPSGDCNPWVLDDCAEGEKCSAAHFDSVPPAWDTTVCVDINGDKAPGDECMMLTEAIYSGEDDCANGALCWNVSKFTQLGTCIAFCQGSPADPECPQGTSCWVAYDGVLPVCTTDCDPLTQDCPLDGELCLPRPDAEGYGCFQDGVDLPGDYSEACGAFNFCAEGLVCINGLGVPTVNCTENQNCCSPLCSIAGGDPCPGEGQSCEPVFETQPAGFEDVGVCTLPL